MWVQFVTKPVVGAAIGWFTNYLAIRMLFRPQRARRVLGVTVQGVIPKRRQEIAVRVAEAVERELFSHRDIREAISDPGYHVALRSQVQDHLRDYLADKLERTPRLVRALVGARFLDRLARDGAQEVMDRLPSLMDGAATALEARFDIEEVIRSKIDSFDLDRLESLVTEIAHKELRFIEVLGGVVGFLVGIVFAAMEYWLA